MTAPTTTFLLKPTTIGKRRSTLPQQQTVTGRVTLPVRKKLTLLQQSVPALGLNPVARLLEQATTSSHPDQLKVFENQLLVLQHEEAFFSLLWQALAEGAIQAQSLAIMVLLRTGSHGRAWVSFQLQNLPSETPSIEPWVLDFLKHQFSL
jgi:hypothetical protein